MDRFIFEEYSTPKSGLGLYRILFAAYILIYLPKDLWIPKLPNAFFNPPIGPTMFFTGFPPPLFWVVVNGLAVASAVCLLFGYKTRVASVSFALLLLVCNCWGYSAGKIDHDSPLIFTPLLMQAAGWGNTYSLDAARRGNAEMDARATSWPFAMMALLIGLAMMTAAVPKAASGWLDPSSHAVRAHLLNNVFVTGRVNWFAAHLLQIKSDVFWESLDYGTVLIEASFLIAVLWRRAFRIVCALACFFHFGIALTMEIAFVENILAYAAFCDWSAIADRAGILLRWWKWILDRISGPRVLGASAAIAGGYLGLGNPLQLPQEWDPIGVAICPASALVATVFLIGQARDWLGRLSRLATS